MLIRRAVVLWMVVAALIGGAAVLLGACGDDDEADSAPTAVAETPDQSAQVDMHEEGHDDADEMHMDAEGEEEHEELDAADARTITVTMTDFAFAPDVIEVHQGEVVRLVLHNTGSVLHDMTTEHFVGHAEAVMSAMHSDSEAHDQEMLEFHAAAETGTDAELLFRADEVGTYELFCSVPGHRELGMVANLVVTA